MQELIDAIRTATSTDATTEQKALGVQACRTIIAALDTEPGKPLVLPGTPRPQPLAGLSLDQVLDLAIARLTMIANEQDKQATVAPPRPNGLRIPVVPAAVPHVAARPVAKANARLKAPATRKV